MKRKKGTKKCPMCGAVIRKEKFNAHVSMCNEIKKDKEKKSTRAPEAIAADLIIIIIVCMIATYIYLMKSSEQESGSLEEETINAPPSHNRYAKFVTNKGAFICELYENETPITTENFIKLTNQGFYNGTKFHRVIDGFMIQGGDPLSKDDDPSNDGTGGPGYTIPDEIRENLKFDKPGILAMANRGPNTGGSQFFITVAETPWLNGKHTIFGRVVSGMDVVIAISKVETDENDRPIDDVILISVEITDNLG